MGRKMKKQQQLGYTRQAVDDDGKEASTKNLNPKARVSRHVSWRQRAGRQPKLPRVRSATPAHRRIPHSISDSPLATAVRKDHVSRNGNVAGRQRDGDGNVRRMACSATRLTAIDAHKCRRVVELERDFLFCFSCTVLHAAFVALSWHEHICDYHGSRVTLSPDSLAPAVVSGTPLLSFMQQVCARGRKP